MIYNVIGKDDKMGFPVTREVFEIGILEGMLN